ncbi:hypothetical protein [Nocardia arizonensis]|uniref:hypothetical protein n=1 Tax=Nocardia arizonensis TaxID=1141647 RepID=UPI0006D1AAE9|nr:hypothetical protein [Nocardia arizonensis]
MRERPSAVPPGLFDSWILPAGSLDSMRVSHWVSYFRAEARGHDAGERATMAWGLARDHREHLPDGRVDNELATAEHYLYAYQDVLNGGNPIAMRLLVLAAEASKIAGIGLLARLGNGSVSPGGPDQRDWGLAGVRDAQADWAHIGQARVPVRDHPDRDVPVDHHRLTDAGGQTPDDASPPSRPAPGGHEHHSDNTIRKGMEMSGFDKAPASDKTPDTGKTPITHAHQTLPGTDFGAPLRDFDKQSPDTPGKEHHDQGGTAAQHPTVNSHGAGHAISDQSHTVSPSTAQSPHPIPIMSETNTGTTSSTAQVGNAPHGQSAGTQAVQATPPATGDAGTDLRQFGIDPDPVPGSPTTPDGIVAPPFQPPDPSSRHTGDPTESAPADNAPLPGMDFVTTHDHPTPSTPDGLPGADFGAPHHDPVGLTDHHGASPVGGHAQPTPDGPATTHIEHPHFDAPPPGM